MSESENNYFLSPTEKKHLAVYRDAINAGFFNEDQHLDGSNAFVPMPAFVTLPVSIDINTGQKGEVSFTPEEFERIERIKLEFQSQPNIADKSEFDKDDNADGYKVGREASERAQEPNTTWET